MRARLARVPSSLLLVIGMVGCAAAAHRSSPWEYGGGIRLAPGWSVRGDAGTTLHPMASYTYLSFDGGYDAIWELGGQVRQRVTPAEGSGLWIGAEAAISRLTEHFDDAPGYDASATANGWSLTAMAGIPVGQSRWGINLYAGAGISDYGSSGKNLRVGVDLQPWFLRK